MRRNFSLKKERNRKKKIHNLGLRMNIFCKNDLLKISVRKITVYKRKKIFASSDMSKLLIF
jgi:hypothetical protein